MNYTNGSATGNIKGGNHDGSSLTWTGITDAGTYTIVATDGNGCHNTMTGSAIVTVNPRLKIKGTFYYYNVSSDIPLTGQDITVKLYLSSDVNHTSQIGPDVTTDQYGYYEFPNLCSALDYDIVATSTHTTAGSVNTTDAAQVNSYGASSYLIQLVRFNAGDVGTSSQPSDLTINATDASRIQHHFVNGTAFDNTWTFWTKGPQINNTTSTLYYPSVTLTTAGDLTADMYGLCTGDFNRSFNPNAMKSASQTLDLIYSGERQVGSNQDFVLPLRIINPSTVGAVSLVLNFPADLMEVTDVLMNGIGGQLDWAVKGNELRIGWNSLDPLRFETADTLLTLKLKTTGAFTKGQSIRFALAPDPLNELADGSYAVISDAVLSAEVIDAAAVGVEEQTGGQKLALSNHPNPFNSYTIFEYTLPEDGMVTLMIRDPLGVTVKTPVNEKQPKGDHFLRFDTGSLPPGVYTGTLLLRSDRDEMLRTIKLVIYR